MPQISAYFDSVEFSLKDLLSRLGIHYSALSNSRKNG